MLCQQETLHGQHIRLLQWVALVAPVQQQKPRTVLNARKVASLKHVVQRP